VTAAVGGRLPSQVPPILPIPKPMPVEELPEAIPVTPSMAFQQRWGELAGIMLWSVIAAAILSVAWSLIFAEYGKLAPVFFLVVAVTWSVVIPSKLWVPGTNDESWTRRLLHMTLGFVIGVFALWLDGYELPVPWNPSTQLEVLHPFKSSPESADALRQSWTGRTYGSENTTMPILACYLSFFGLMFLVLRWWKVTEPTRSKRLSIWALAAVVLWAWIFLFLLPSTHHRELGFVSMIMASVVVQVTCPWRERVAAKKKNKLRLATA
jgi:hypothetical protein